MNKKTLLFDGRNLAKALKSDGCRTGIYFVSINLLKEFLQMPLCDVTIYCNLENTLDLKAFLEKNTAQKINMFYKKRLKLFKMLSEWKEKKKHYQQEKKYIHLIFVSLCSLTIKMLRPIFPFRKVYDLYFSPQFAFIHQVKAKKRFLLLYDVIQLPSAKINSEYVCEKWASKLFKQLKETSGLKTYYFSISENTKADFLRYFPELTDKQIKVTPLAASESFYHETDKQRLMAVREKYNIPTNKKYVFSLCTLEPRKNLIRAVKTFVQFIEKNKITDLIFVLGGGHWDTFLTKLEGEIKYIPDGLIKKVGYVDDADLATLYSGAEWFVYTSQYEGFGLPPLEAMQCGCPVITSNNSSLPEVVGDAGIMIDWDSDEQHIKAYEEYYFNKDLRDANAAKSMERAKEFSWQKTANLMIKEMMK